MLEFTRKNKKLESEFDKEKALLEQKVQFLEKQLEERASNERQYMSSWNSKNSELSNEMRQVSHKYESELKNLALSLDEEKERANEAETALTNLQADLQTKAQIWKESEQRYKEMIEKAQTHARQVEAASNALKTDGVAKLQDKLKERLSEIESLKEKLDQSQQSTHLNAEQLKSKMQQAIKDMAIKEQNNQFL